MFKKILLLTTYFVGSLSAVCYYQPDITNSNILFTYKGNVYDVTGYDHPGGQGPMNQLVGNDLELFVNANSKSFHLTPGNKFFTDLDTLFVGTICNTPIPITTIPPPNPVVTTVPIYTNPVITSVPPYTNPFPVTTISCNTTATTVTTTTATTTATTTDISISDTSVPVTENITFDNQNFNIANNGFCIKNDSIILFLFIFFLLI